MVSDPLRAAGGVVVRGGRILLVHRPKYNDWAFPKGKLEDGESWEAAALREVEEETGLRCALGAYVGATHYELREGTKEVRYFLMSGIGDATPQNEIDDVRWVSPVAARNLLSYVDDRQLLDALG